MKLLLPLLLLLSVRLSAEDVQKVWVKISYYDVAEKSDHYYFGLTDKAVVAKLDGGETVGYIKLEQTCWFVYDKEGKITGLSNDDKDDLSGTMYISTRKVDEVALLAKPPAEYLKKVMDAEANAAEKAALP